MPRTKTKKLKDKQLRFVDEYLVDHNATQAAIRAGYSSKTAVKQGSRLLTNADISRLIRTRQISIAERTEVTAEWILDRLKDEATTSGEGSSHAGRVKALELLGKRLKMWTDKVETTQTGTLRITEVIVSGEDSQPTPA